ncbi:MAG TPA: glycosyltransferase family 1 protein, partial [Rhodospirillales bacterium]|nr:glycosyltransferase family 1 protein [Rhodospirillales bacterium]
MRIAFYAPLKPADHPAPSGDRRMARLLIRALEMAGHEVEQASRLRSYDGGGDNLRQRKLRALGGRMAERLIRRYQRRPPEKRPQAWFTYHLYHKAPDWLGPAVSRAFDIPYVAAEASYAPKQENGPWAEGFDAAARAIALADLVFCPNSNDLECVLPLIGDPERLVPLTPFIEVSRFAASAR